MTDVEALAECLKRVRWVRKRIGLIRDKGRKSIHLIVADMSAGGLIGHLEDERKALKTSDERQPWKPPEPNWKQYEDYLSEMLRLVKKGPESYAATSHQVACLGYWVSSFGGITRGIHYLAGMVEEEGKGE